MRIKISNGEDPWTCFSFYPLIFLICVHLFCSFTCFYVLKNMFKLTCGLASKNLLYTVPLLYIVTPTKLSLWYFNFKYYCQISEFLFCQNTNFLQNIVVLDCPVKTMVLFRIFTSVSKAYLTPIYSFQTFNA